MDHIIWQEGSRIVSNGPDGPVDAKTRLAQADMHAALTSKDGSARARVLDQLQESGERIAREKRDIFYWFMEAKVHLQGEFRNAKKSRRTAPDILPHPDHVDLSDGLIRFNGPTSDEGREWWEQLKATIRIAACFQKIAQAEVRRTGCAIAACQLQAAKKHRRKLMRAVPKG